jgi:uncharacterized membrane protein
MPTGVKPDPLARAATPARLRAFADAAELSDAALERALEIATETPDGQSWRRTLIALFTYLGACLLLAGVIFFFAYNWNDMSRFMKLGLLEAGVVAAAVGAHVLGQERISGRAALAAAAVLVGPLLAVYGQIYQTGADAYELFLGWSVLIIPWVLLARLAPLWLMLLVLVDTTLVLYWQQVVDHDNFYPVIALLMYAAAGAAWLASELLRDRLDWLRARWIPRTFAVFAIAPLLMVVFWSIIEHIDFEGSRTAVIACWLVWLGSLFALGLYRKRRPDLFMLALGVGSTIVVVTTLIGKALLEGSDSKPIGQVLLLALVVVAELGTAAWWLREEGKRMEESA